RGVIYSPRHFFADYDQDGETELVMVSHQKAFFFDSAKNALELEVGWPQIRTYNATLAMLPVGPGEAPSLLSINPHIPGVERVDVRYGQAEVVWRQVVAEQEDQYQTQVKIAPGAPDPFLDLDGSGKVYIVASVTNERNDGLVHLNIFDAANGNRLLDEAGVEFLCADHLDGDAAPELLLKRGDTLQIAHWINYEFVVMWEEQGVQPLLRPLPSEGDLARSRGANTPVWREGFREGECTREPVEGANQAANPRSPSRLAGTLAPTASAETEFFLMQFPEGVYACVFRGASVVKDHAVTVHEALKNVPVPPGVEQVRKEKPDVVVTRDGQEVYRYSPRCAPEYLAPPAVVGEWNGATRVLVIDAQQRLLSLNAAGVEESVVVDGVQGEQVSLVDTDGDGKNEVLTLRAGADGAAQAVVIGNDGAVRRSFGLIDGTTALRLGPCGNLGAGKGRWLALCYDMQLGHRPTVVVWDLGTGRELWRRDHFESPNTSYGEDYRVKFVLHAPTAVYDYNHDGVEDLLAASENFYGILNGLDGEELIPPVVFSDFIKGHWQAYASPIVVPAPEGAVPMVFHHRAFAQTVTTTLAGAPLWHYGLTRDTTATAWPGIGDADGDGRYEFLQSRRDGQLTLFSEEPADALCPTCAKDTPLDASNHGGTVLACLTLPPPLSDIASFDADGDGRDDFLVGAGDGKLYAVKYREGALEILWQAVLGERAGAPIVADLDNDQRPEVLVPVRDGRLVCLSPSE
ncbi:MAG: VCBS repeat-containing protein, partial [Candidatus Hydrogenedentes bacterium]|nr:VCBS repeat-containing protein [Candidatus Hydrogenedentota bacterium]